jgi:hypothetical protein
MADTEYNASSPNSNGLDVGSRVGGIYKAAELDWAAPEPVEQNAGKGKPKEKIESKPSRKGKPSIFNRYSIFFVNQQNTDSGLPEDYYDSPNRIKDEALQKVRRDPTASAIINWSRTGKTNACEFAWEDFLWCKNYGIVPNNYMVTLRRFTVPPEDDLFDEKKNVNPDIGRLITWVDGETNKWENVGLKWSHGMVWKEFEAQLQVEQAQSGYGNEAGALSGLPGGNVLKAVANLTDTGASNAARSHNPNSSSINPYSNSNVVFGPIDVIDKVQMRNRGLTFEQELTLVFEYQLRSIDGINPKIAMLDLLSNVFIVTSNKGSFWGGEARFYGGNPRKLKPFGDPDKLASGDYKGYLESIISGENGIATRFDGLSGGKGLSFEGIANAAKGMAGNLMSQIAGGMLDKMGRPGVAALNSLLSGESTGMWHVTVGNPANPIISLGNMILAKTDVELYGPLGFDDFPTKLKVTCSLKPARQRERIEMMAMFSRNNRMYLTEAPQNIKYTGNSSGGKNGGTTPKGTNQKNVKKTNEPEDLFKKEDFEIVPKAFVADRFPNHMNRGAITTETAANIF